MDNSKLEERIGYHFNDKNILLVSLIHSSAINEMKLESNQRLEFLGDSVLQLVISSYIYNCLPTMNEGNLSKLRSLIVCADSLYIAASSFELNEFIILGRGEQMNGGNKKKNIIADAFESLIGAIYLDGGYDCAKEFIMKTLGEITQKAISGKLTYDFKTMLQECIQSKNSGELSYELVEVKGPDHNQTFYSRAVIGDRKYEIAKGHSRKQSEQNAAEIALKYFQ